MVEGSVQYSEEHVEALATVLYWMCHPGGLLKGIEFSTQSVSSLSEHALVCMCEVFSYSERAVSGKAFE